MALLGLAILAHSARVQATTCQFLLSATPPAHLLAHLSASYPVELLTRVWRIAGEINSYEREAIFTNFFSSLEKAKTLLEKSISQGKIENPDSLPRDWPLDPWAHLYVDLMGVKSGASHSTFYDLIDTLPYYEKLGVRNLYLLPHYESPMDDGGYDVSNHRRVRQSLGGNAAFSEFIKAAQQRGFRVMVDFIPGHVSESHPLFLEALSGDQRALDFFVHDVDPLKYRPVKSESGENLIEYTHSDGKVSKRLIEFPDVMENHYRTEVINGKNIHFYSSFYPFQLDLNNQNAEVLKHHLLTLSHLLAQGASGIRADAVLYWIKYPGSVGKNLKESGALAEYFNTFIKSLNPNFHFAPEAVTSTEEVINLLGPKTEINGTVTGSRSSMMFSFEEAMQIKASVLAGDFTPWFKHSIRKQALTARPESSSLLPLHKHDEWELGFLDPELRSEISRNLFTFKNGFSGLGRLIEAMQGDTEKLAFYYKFALGLYGSPMIYYGDELAKGNDWEYAWKKARQRVNILQRLGRIDSEEEQSLKQYFRRIDSTKSVQSSPPHPDSPLYPYFDRDIHRGPVHFKNISQAMSDENKIFNVLSRLLKIRNNSHALRDGGVELPLETFNPKTAAFIRRFQISSGKTSEVIVVANASNSPGWVNLRLDQIKLRTLKKLIELESNQSVPFEVANDGGESFIRVYVQSKQVLWLRPEGTQ